MTDTSVTNLTARVKKIPYIPYQPGQCSLCNRAVHEEGFADPNIFIDWYGQIVFCYDCVTEMGRVFGMLTAEEAKGFVSLNASQAEEIERLRISVANLETTLDAISLDRLNMRGVVTTAVVVTEDSQADDDGTSSSAIEADGTFPEAEPLLARISNAKGYDDSDGTESDDDTVKSTVKQGPTDVHKSTGEQSGINDLGL